MSIKRAIIFIIFFSLFILVKLGDYISVEILEVDDCIMELKINNIHYFQFNQEESVGLCYKNRFENYPMPKKNYTLINYDYKYGDKLEFTFGDSDHTEGWFIINVYFNEYLIQTKDRVFWKCRDCENYFSKDYILYDNDFEYDNKNYNYRAKVVVYDKIFFYYIPQNSSRYFLF